MQWKEWADVIPKEELELLQIGRQQEIQQPLIDLGYLSANKAESTDAHSFQQTLLPAIQHFRADYFAAGLLKDKTQNLLYFPTYQLDSVELNLLHLLTDLDGEMSIPTLPRFGQCNIWSRVIHYRLQILGLFSDKVNKPFSHTSTETIRQISEWLHASSMDTLQVIHLCGNIPLLTKKILETGALRKTVVTFRYQTQKLPKDILQELKEETEEVDNEAQLIAEEEEIHNTLDEVDKTLFTPEQAAWEKYENKTKSKAKRLQRIKLRMNKILAKEQKILTAHLGAEVALQKKIRLLQTQETLLQKDLQKANTAVSKQKELLRNLQSTRKKNLKKKQKELSRLLQSLRPPNDIPTLLAMIAQHNQNNHIRKQNIAHLKNQSGKEHIIAQLKADLAKAEKEIANLQSKIKCLQNIENLKEQINLLKNNNTAFENEAQKLSILQDNAQRIKERLQRVQSERQNLQTNLAEATQLRKQQIALEQQKLQQLHKRLKRLQEKVNGLRFRFKAKLKKSLDPDFYDTLRRKVFQSNDTSFLEQLSSTPFNQFLIRLIQIRQWMNGHYYGYLDGEFADRTFQSILDFTEEEELKSLRLKYILTKLGQNQKGFWLLNAQYFFECLVTLDHSPAPNNSAELIALYEQCLQNGEHIYQSEKVKEAWQAYNAELKTGLQTSEKGIRRFYLGGKSIAKSIGRVLHRILRFILKGTKIVLRILKNLLKIIYKEIREGTRNFFEGMAFLFSRRVIETQDPMTTKRAISRFDFDFDSMVLLSDDLPYETHDLHIQNCMAKTSNLHFSMRLCGKVLKWVFSLASGTITWPRLAIKIAFYFKRLLVDYFKLRKRRKSKI